METPGQTGVTTCAACEWEGNIEQVFGSRESLTALDSYLACTSFFSLMTYTCQNTLALTGGPGGVPHFPAGPCRARLFMHRHLARAQVLWTQ